MLDSSSAVWRRLRRVTAIAGLCLGLTSGAKADGELAEQNLSPLRAQLLRAAISHVGARYQLGANGHGKFDCSGLVQTAYQAVGQPLPRTAREMLRVGERISYQDAHPGDLLLYDWGSRRHSSLHVMIYLGNDLAVHASPSARAVEITSISRPQWRRHFVAGARILPTS